MGDGGLAVGGCYLHLKEELNVDLQPRPISHVFYGPRYEDAEMEKALEGLSSAKVTRPDDMPGEVADLIHAGKVVARFSGSMEFGPRALGSRSFIADPRFSEITEIMNIKIKKREPFRPFAPSVVEERSAEFFDLKQPSPFMTIVCPVLPAKRKSLQAVAHIDGSARPQTVNRRVLPKYHALLTRFGELTGIPVVLNTSFNIQEPIVCTPEEAVATFLHSGVDFLCMQNCFVTRE